MRYLLINLFAVTLLLTSCKKEKTTNDKIIEIIRDSLKVDRPFNKVIILQEHGCHVCNTKFANYILEESHNDSTLIIYSLQNVSGYVSDVDKIDKAIIDRRQLFYKTNVLNHSAVILLKESKIDTILNFSDARVYDQNLDYLSSK